MECVLCGSKKIVHVKHGVIDFYQCGECAYEWGDGLALLDGSSQVLLKTESEEEASRKE